jgi:Domain of unknown function (DUF222)/HNH endonuclease
MFDADPSDAIRALGLVQAADELHAQAAAAQRELFRVIAELDRHGGWRDAGARDLAHWLSMRYGISAWKSHRWIAAAHALDGLPRLADAFASGRLGIDKVVELCRFATAEDEERLVAWAAQVSSGAIRHRGDVLARVALEEVREAERTRTLSWWVLDEGRRLGLYAELAAAQGAAVVRAIDRLADRLPTMPGETDPAEPFTVDARRADALVALCSASIAADPRPDRATVVVHAPLRSLVAGIAGCEVEDGPALHPETIERLMCNARVQTLIEDDAGTVVGLGRTTREPSTWMVRQVRYRDRGCRFPGCGARSFTEAHHVVWWRHGGRTDLDNLVLICSFHHKLVHELGWRLDRDPDGLVRWFDPGGVRYRAGPTRDSDPMPHASAGIPRTVPA